MNKEKLVRTFDDNATSYDKYRPSYPEKLVEEIIERSQIKKNDRILEIGSGTGQLSVDFVKRGYHLLGIEKGASLSRIASDKLERYGKGHIVHSTFEDWTPNGKFNLVISAQAFHWIDKESGIEKILKLLEERGSLGLVWNMDISQETEFWKQTSKVYKKYLPTIEAKKSMEETIDEHWDFMKLKEGFTNLNRKEYRWEKTYSKEEYLGLLGTFSPHMSLKKNRREKFFQDIETIIENLNDQVVKYYKSVLLIANKGN